MWPAIAMTVAFVMPLDASAPSSVFLAVDPWQLISERRDESFKVYLDPASVKLREGYVSAWIIYDFAKPQFDESPKHRPYQSEALLWIFDCAGKRAEPVMYIDYPKKHGQGRPISRESEPPDPSQMQAFADGSIGNDNIEAVCGRWSSTQSVTRTGTAPDGEVSSR